MSQPDPLQTGLSAKPTRSFTKRLTVANNAAAWAVMAFAIWLGAELAVIVVPAMVALILGILSAYQLTGHMDLRAIAGQAIGGRIGDGLQSAIGNWQPGSSVQPKVAEFNPDAAPPPRPKV